MSDGEVYVTFGADAGALNQAFADIRQNAAELNGQMVEVARVMDNAGNVAEINMGRGLRTLGDNLRNVDTQHLAVIQGIKGVDLSMQQAAATHQRAAETLHYVGDEASRETGIFDNLQESLAKLAAVAGVTLSADALKTWVEDTIKAGDALDQEAARYGVALQDIQQLHGVASIGGASGTDLVESLSKLQTELRKSEDDASKTAAAFKAIGLSFDDMKGKSPLALIEAIAQALSQYSDGANKTAAVQRLLGDAGVDMIRSLDQGRQGFRDIEDAAVRAGNAMSDSTIAALAKTERDLNEMKLAWNSLAFAGIVPAVDVGIQAVTRLVESIRPDQILGALQNIADGFIDFAGKIAEALARAQGAWDAFVANVASMAPGLVAGVKSAANSTLDVLNDVASNGGHKYIDPYLNAAGEKIAEGMQRIGLGTQADVDRWKGVAEGATSAAAAGDSAFGTLDAGAIKTELAVGRVRDATRQAREEFDRLTGAASRPHSDAAMGGAAYNGNSALRPGNPAGPQAGVMPDANAGGGGAARNDALQVARAAYEQEAEAAREAAQEQETALNGLLQRKQITTAQWLAGSLSALDREQDAIQDAADRAIATAGLTATQKIELANREARELAQIANKVALDQNKAAEETKKGWDATFNQINGAFDAQVNGLLRGTQSFGQALKNVLASLTEDVIKFALKWALQHAETVAMNIAGTNAETSAHVAGNLAKTASDGAAAAAGGLAWAGAALKSIAASAAEAFAGVFGFFAPILGPAAAGPAAGAEATVLAAGSAVASADIGMWQVPNDMLTLVHHNELIMPAAQSEAFRNLLSGGATQGAAAAGAAAASGGDTHLHVNVSAVDAAGVRGFFAQHADHIASALHSAARGGSPSALKLMAGR